MAIIQSLVASQTGCRKKRKIEEYTGILLKSTADLYEVIPSTGPLTQAKAGAESPKLGKFETDFHHSKIRTRVYGGRRKPQIRSCERASSRYWYFANAGCSVAEPLPLTSSLSSPSNT